MDSDRENKYWKHGMPFFVDMKTSTSGQRTWGSQTVRLFQLGHGQGPSLLYLRQRQAQQALEGLEVELWAAVEGLKLGPATQPVHSDQNLGEQYIHAVMK